VAAGCRRGWYPHRSQPSLSFADKDDYEKILVERVALSEPQLPGTVLRLPCVFGPGDRHRRLRTYLKRMEDGRPTILLDERQADWLWTRGYVENVAAAIVLALLDERASGHVYNVGERTIQKEVYAAALSVPRPQLQKLYADCFTEHKLTAIVFPTTVLSARPINEHGDTGQDTVMVNSKQVPTFPTYARNTSPASIAGLPGLSLPIGMTRSGLPVGIEFDGPVSSDRTLLGIGMNVESELGTLPPPKL
jgi:hypothetical protein